VLASGVVAVALVAVFAVTAAPRRASGPVAMSATTLPAYSIAPAAATNSTSSAADAPAPDATLEPVRLAQPLLSTSSGIALPGAPKTVAAPVPLDTAADPVGHSDGLEPATPVHLITDSHVYRLSWGDLDRVIAPDGSIVIDADGMLLGTFADGRFNAD